MRLLIEYIEATRRFQRNARLYLISNALSGITFGIILVLYNLYLASLGYGTDFIGLILFIGTIGGGLAIFPAGMCIDRFGGKQVLIWSNLLIGFVGAGQMLFRAPLPLLISSFWAGVGAAFTLVVNAPFLSANSAPAERSHLFSLNIVVTLAMSVLGEALGGVLPLWFRSVPWLMAPLPSQVAWMLASQPLTRSYQLALLLSGLIALPSLPPLFLISHDQSKVADSAAPPVLTDGRSLRSRLLAVLTWSRQDMLSTVRSSPMAVMLFVQVLIALGAGLFIPYFNVYFVQHLGASSALFGVIDGGANALNAILTLFAPLIAVRMGKVITMAVTRLVSIPLMLVIGFTASLPLAAALYPFRQGLMDMSQGIMQVFSMDVVSTKHRGLANSSYQAAYQGASALGAPIGGLIIAHLGYSPVFLMAAMLYFLAVMVLWGRFGRGETERPV